MKSFLNRIAIALLITSLAGVSVYAKSKKERVTFPTNIKVNGTMVKKGVYDLKFDDETGELAIMKDNKVIARATTNSVKRERKAKTLEIRSTGSGDETSLLSVAFSGSGENLVITGSQASR